VLQAMPSFGVVLVRWVFISSQEVESCAQRLRKIGPSLVGAFHVVESQRTRFRTLPHPPPTN
jgi:biotin operon repressor